MRLEPAACIGRTVEVEVDRPLGSRHPAHPDLVYELNYGFVPDTMAADGEPVDAYIIDFGEPVKQAEGRVVAVVRRRDDVEDKLVVRCGDQLLTTAAIEAAVHFVEQYFDSKVLRE